MTRTVVLTMACAGVMAAGSSMAGSATSTASAVADGKGSGVSVSASSVNGVPRIDSRTIVRPGTIVSATARSSPGGSASASASVTIEAVDSVGHGFGVP
jgi:hypothetical protein